MSRTLFILKISKSSKFFSKYLVCVFKFSSETEHVPCFSHSCAHSDSGSAAPFTVIHFSRISFLIEAMDLASNLELLLQYCTFKLWNSPGHNPWICHWFPAGRLQVCVVPLWWKSAHTVGGHDCAKTKWLKCHFFNGMGILLVGYL